MPFSDKRYMPEVSVLTDDQVDSALRGYGAEGIELTREQVDALLEGATLEFCVQSEYVAFVRLKR